MSGVKHHKDSPSGGLSEIDHRIPKVIEALARKRSV